MAGFLKKQAEQFGERVQEAQQARVARAAPPSPYEYHVMGANGMPGIAKELAKRADEGWDLVSAYQETSGGFMGFAGRRHILIFRRPRDHKEPPPA